MPGFWKRPVTRMYSYNLDLGDMQSRAARARSEVRTSSNVRNISRAQSPYVADQNNVSAFANYKNALLDTSRALRQESAANQMAREQSRVQSMRQQQEMRRSMAETRARSMEPSMSSMQMQNMSASVANNASAASRMQQQQQQSSTSTTQSTYRTESRHRVADDINKRMADVHMMPWSAGAELDEANSASSRARSRISELERELEEITRKAMMTSSHARQTAAQMAKAAQLEDSEAMSNSYRKSKKVMIESSQKVR